MLRKMITKSKEYETLEKLIVTDENETLCLLRNIWWKIECKTNTWSDELIRPKESKVGSVR